MAVEAGLPAASGLVLPPTCHALFRSCWVACWPSSPVSELSPETGGHHCSDLDIQELSQFKDNPLLPRALQNSTGSGKALRLGVKGHSFRLSSAFPQHLSRDPALLEKEPVSPLLSGTSEGSCGLACCMGSFCSVRCSLLRLQKSEVTNAAFGRWLLSPLSSWGPRGAA